MYIALIVTFWVFEHLKIIIISIPDFIIEFR